MNTATEVRTKQENPLYNLLFNIVLPVFILHRLSKAGGDSGPLIALVIALALPLGYGIYDYKRRKKPNMISLIGFINIAVTGSLALLKLDGQWFALKEAFFPYLIGVAVLLSVPFQRPFLKSLFWNEHLLQIERIESQISANQNKEKLNDLFGRSTYFFSASFFISGSFNFLLASKIFLPIDPALSTADHTRILNEQIAQMTWKAYITIALPMMIFIMLVLWYFLRGLKSLSGININDLMVADKPRPQSGT